VGFAATFYPADETHTILRRWRHYVAGAPDEVTSEAVAITFPAVPHMPGAILDRPVIIVGGVYVGYPDEGLRVMAPLRELGTPLLDGSGPTPGQHSPHGRRNRPGGPGGGRVRRALGAVHGLDRRDVDGSHG
jgi:hypothetical protein